ncbi:MAG: hypothetical protein QM754_14630 [Tepidisphaeraceae bacterium]
MDGRFLPPLRWLFFDMNSFFASVEQNAHPHLQGRPVGVIPVESESTSLIAASLEAKRAGCKTGTPVWQAREMCPDIAILKARPAEYVKVHRKLLDACDLHVPVCKVYSIDEWSVRLMPAEESIEVATDLVRRVKGQIAKNVGACIRASAGIAPTRLLAKIAADSQKTDGLTVLNVDQLPNKLADHEMRDLPGISEAMEARLERAGVHTVADLWAISRPEARRIWGSVTGEHWWYGFHGIDVPEPGNHRSVVGHSNVLEPKYRNEEGARAMMIRLLCKAASRIRHYGYFAFGLSLCIRHDCGRVWADRIGLNGVQDTPTILTQFARLWQRRQKMRQHLVERREFVGSPMKVSVDLSGLERDANVPATLFDALDRPRRLSFAMDQINRRYGPHTMFFGSMHSCREHMDDKIAFGRIPDEILPM